MNLRDQFQQGMAGVLTKRQPCGYPTFYYYYPYNYQKIFSYMLCAMLPKWEQLPPWGVTIAVALNKRWPFETWGGRLCFNDPVAPGAAAPSGLQPSRPSWQDVQGLWPATSKLCCISSWCKFLKQAKTTGCFKKKKKKSLVCTFMCLGNQEIPHYCSLDILRSFTSTGHETGPRIIHKSVFKAKCVEKGYRWKRAQA